MRCELELEKGKIVNEDKKKRVGEGKGGREQ